MLIIPNSRISCIYIFSYTTTYFNFLKSRNSFTFRVYKLKAIKGNCSTVPNSLSRASAELHISRASPPSSRSASHTPSACFLSGCRRRRDVSVYPGSGDRVSSGCTPAHQGLCCKTHRALQAHSEVSLLRCSKSR